MTTREQDPAGGQSAPSAVEARKHIERLEKDNAKLKGQVTDLAFQAAGFQSDQPGFELLKGAFPGFDGDPDIAELVKFGKKNGIAPKAKEVAPGTEVAGDTDTGTEGDTKPPGGDKARQEAQAALDAVAATSTDDKPAKVDHNAEQNKALAEGQIDLSIAHELATSKLFGGSDD